MLNIKIEPLNGAYLLNITDKFKTGNIIFDVLISSSIIYLITNFKLNSLKKYLFKFFSRYFKNTNYYPLIFTAKKKIATSFYDSKEIMTIPFLALLHKIKTLRCNNIRNVKEYVSDNMSNILKNKKGDNTDIMYIVNQEEWFYISDNIKCYLIEEERTEIYEDDNKLNNKKLNELSIKLVSDKLDIYNLQLFVQTCVKEYNIFIYNKNNNKKYYFLYDKFDDDIGSSLFFKFEQNSRKTIKHLIGPEIPNIINSIDYFLNNEEEYNNNGFPWKYGLLLYGKPGTGKTSFTKAIANYTNRSIIAIPLSRIKTNLELMMAMYQDKIDGVSIPYNKRIILFEDIDCMCLDLVKERTTDTNNVKEDINNMLLNAIQNSNIQNSNIQNSNKINIDDKLTLSFFLNLLDGAIEYHGIMYIMTTNRRNILDSALTRPGRIDKEVELKYCTCDCIKQMISNFFKINKDLLNYDFPNNKYSPAKVEQVIKSNKDNYEKVIKYLLK